MKSTGCVRPLDKLGRVVIPKELRTTMNLGELDSVEIFIENNLIILRKYEPGCTFCGGMKNLRGFGGHQVCEDCRDELRRGLNVAIK